MQTAWVPGSSMPLGSDDYGVDMSEKLARISARRPPGAGARADAEASDSLRLGFGLDADAERELDLIDPQPDVDLHRHDVSPSRRSGAGAGTEARTARERESVGTSARGARGGGEEHDASCLHCQISARVGTTPRAAGPQLSARRAPRPPRTPMTDEQVGTGEHCAIGSYCEVQCTRTVDCIIPTRSACTCTRLGSSGRREARRRANRIQDELHLLWRPAAAAEAPQGLVALTSQFSLESH